MLPAPPQSPKARQAPCSTLAFSGHVAPEVGVARNNLMLVPITSVPGGCISRLAWRWAEAGLAWPHPARHSTRAPLRAGGRIPSQAGPVPRRHRHSEGQVPSIWCPWPAPSAGAGAFVWATQNPIVSTRRVSLPGQGPAPAPAALLAQTWPDTAASSAGLPAKDALVQPVSPCGPLHPEPSPLPTTMLGGFCQLAAKVLMVLCPALNYFPDCHCHVLASGAGCDPAEPDSAAAAWGANGRSTPHVEFNYWLSSLTEYIG